MSALADWSIEQQRINFLIESVEHTDAVFIRNGRDYSGPKAADHLRSKLQAAITRVSDLNQITAERFIDEVASKSFFTGRPYMIRLTTGETVSAHDWLTEQLRFFPDSR
jgi:hypothetical protein